jgi:hypothetical protein
MLKTLLEMKVSDILDFLKEMYITLCIVITSAIIFGWSMNHLVQLFTT